MTREEAIKIWLEFGGVRSEASHRRRLPQPFVDTFMVENAADVIDGLIALGLLKVDQPSPQEKDTPHG